MFPAPVTMHPNTRFRSRSASVDHARPTVSTKPRHSRATGVLGHSGDGFSVRSFPGSMFGEQIRGSMMPEALPWDGVGRTLDAEIEPRICLGASRAGVCHEQKTVRPFYFKTLEGDNSRVAFPVERDGYRRLCRVNQRRANIPCSQLRLERFLS